MSLQQGLDQEMNEERAKAAWNKKISMPLTKNKWISPFIESLPLSLRAVHLMMKKQEILKPL